MDMGCCAAEGHSVFIPSPHPPPPHPNFSDEQISTTYPQALVIQKVKSAIHWIIQLISLILFCWTVICLVDSAIHITFKQPGPVEDQQSKALLIRVPFMLIKTMTALLNL